MQNKYSEMHDKINEIIGADEPSSIIIDTKVNSGSVPVLTKKQREEFLKRNQGLERVVVMMGNLKAINQLLPKR